MIEDDTVYLTLEGLKQIEDEVAYLKTTRREEIAAKLETAIKQGDLKENADYHDAKEEQGFIEGRIRQLEDSLRRAKVIDNRGPANVVRVGSTVTVPRSRRRGGRPDCAGARRAGRPRGRRRCDRQCRR